MRRRIFKAVLNRPSGLAWAVCAGTCMHGPEGAPVQQCTGATRRCDGGAVRCSAPRTGPGSSADAAGRRSASGR